MKQGNLFHLLSTGLEALVRDANPWWRGEALSGVPPFRRWAFGPVVESLRQGLSPATVLRGPRQIGKTTLLNQVVGELLGDGVKPERIFRLQFDDLPDLKRLSMPLIDLVDWYSKNILHQTLNQAANENQSPFLLLDEVHNLADWAPQLKHLVDIGRVRSLVTGSSALRIEAGRDSLAGRITTLEMGPLLLREIGELRGFGSAPAYLPHNGLGPLKEKSFGRTCERMGNPPQSAAPGVCRILGARRLPGGTSAHGYDVGEGRGFPE